ncbi:SAM-dependent methyltransferase [Kribbella sp. VKM Ac-2566]|uniref:SAM-dependent methyltransferase n=1 Tax=Kribbella sp. VKM Ac-2566 TaxID=2512218 RepID=UPI001063A753|nr:SAM-dependent methyltransferase [Kribbella sp. VKM Ac-2566]TDW98206.1 S-adenosyl methyltransferase [Kribbella sp. VKM Ac-2566]
MTDQPRYDGGLIARGIDTTRPSVARVYDYALGGKDNYESDRELYRQIMKIAPETPLWARANRRWLHQAVTWLAEEGGVRRFIDAGSGLPTVENTHQIAQKVSPDASVLYIDNDPSVVAHGRALLLDNDRTQFTAADLTKPDEVLADPAVAGMLADGQPVALVMALMLHHIADYDETLAIAGRYVDALPPGSYLAITHACNPGDGGPVDVLVTELLEKVKDAFPTLAFRSVEQISSLFHGLEILDPGVVRLADWHVPGGRVEEDPPVDIRDAIYGGIAHKP